jgi:hypothetical protein
MLSSWAFSLDILVNDNVLNERHVKDWSKSRGVRVFISTQSERHHCQASRCDEHTQDKSQNLQGNARIAERDYKEGAIEQLPPWYSVLLDPR